MVEMKVICFKGKSNTGKSKTIKKILNEFFNIIMIPKTKKDFSLCLLYKEKKVGICSYGDNLDLIKKGLIPLKKENCEIILCASRTKGNVYDKIIELFGKENITYFDCKNPESSIEYNKRISFFTEKFNRILNLN